MKVLVQAVMVRTADGRYTVDPIRSIYAEVPTDRVAEMIVRSGLLPQGGKE